MFELYLNGTDVFWHYTFQQTMTYLFIIIGMMVYNCYLTKYLCVSHIYYVQDYWWKIVKIVLYKIVKTNYRNQLKKIGKTTTTSESVNIEKQAIWQLIYSLNAWVEDCFIKISFLTGYQWQAWHILFRSNIYGNTR